MRDELGRMQVLARRVRWLDRWRRWIAIASALLLIPFANAWLQRQLGAEWPTVHTKILTGLVAVLAWAALEVVLIGAVSLWEAELVKLTRRRSLPRAIVWRSR
jgi:hypothetical protein